MTTSDGFERDVPALLEELYLGPTPPYRDDILRRAAATRQRPGWTFIERWLPVSAITRRLAAAPRVPWRAVGLAALLLIAVVIAALFVGSQQHRVPPPFGPAANGQIPFIRNGDLWLGDPVTGRSKLLIGEAGDDAVPQFSPDGTKLAYIRDVPIEGATNLPIDIWVAGADGTNRTKVTPEPIWGWKWIGWTPDSRQLAVVSAPTAVSQVDLYDASGKGSIQPLKAAAGTDFVWYRPPDGREILFRAPHGTKRGLFAMNADGTNPHLLFEGLDDCCNPLDLDGAVYTPDGNQVFFQMADSSQAPNACCYLWVMNADGSNPHEFRPDSGASWDGYPSVSPDGKWIAWWRVPGDGTQHGIAVARTDGKGPLIDTGPKLVGNAQWVWSPDSSKILMWDNDGGDGKAALLDPEGGPSTEVPWQSDADLDWQRLALP